MPFKLFAPESLIALGNKPLKHHVMKVKPRGIIACIWCAVAFDGFGQTFHTVGQNQTSKVSCECSGEHLLSHRLMWLFFTYNSVDWGGVATNLYLSSGSSVFETEGKEINLKIHLLCPSGPLWQMKTHRAGAEITWVSRALLTALVCAAVRHNSIWNSVTFFMFIYNSSINIYSHPWNVLMTLIFWVLSTSHQRRDCQNNNLHVLSFVLQH